MTTTTAASREFSIGMAAIKLGESITDVVIAEQGEVDDTHYSTLVSEFYEKQQKRHRRVCLAKAEVDKAAADCEFMLKNSLSKKRTLEYETKVDAAKDDFFMILGPEFKRYHGDVDEAFEAWLTSEEAESAERLEVVRRVKRLFS